MGAFLTVDVAGSIAETVKELSGAVIKTQLLDPDRYE
jgi:hypothetical protein